MTGSRREGALDTEYKLQLLIDSVSDYAIFLLDRDGNVESWNRGAQAIKGYTKDEILGRSISTFYTPEDRAAGLPAKLLRIAREEGRVESEGWRVRKNGTRFWSDVVITALHADDGELVGYAKVTRDLTDRRRSEEERLEAETRFRLMVDSVHDYALYMLDLEGRVMTWNPGAQRLKGYTAGEIVGQHFSRFYEQHDIDSGKVDRELEIATAEGRFEEEGWRVRRDGTRFWANVVITPLRDAQGKQVGFAKITRDLTDRRNAEAERLRLAHAQESVRLRDDFLSIASHELRTPLMALQLQIESALAMIEDQHPKVATKLQRADKSVGRLTGLVDTLLDVSRISTGRLEISPRPLDLAEIVQEIVDRMQEAAVEAGCELRAEITPGLVGSWDPLRMGQMVSNLIANALKYASGTPVEVNLTREGDQALLCVTDRGPGIEAGQLDRIFGRFERAVDARHYGGLGLGLYVSHEIVTAHRGEIRAHNRRDGGAAFEVRLPLGGV